MREPAHHLGYRGGHASVGQGGPVDHPSLAEMFEDFADGRYRLRQGLAH